MGQQTECVYSNESLEKLKSEVGRFINTHENWLSEEWKLDFGDADETTVVILNLNNKEYIGSFDLETGKLKIDTDKGYQELADAVLHALWEQCGILAANREDFPSVSLDTIIAIPELNISVDITAVQSITVEFRDKRENRHDERTPEERLETIVQYALRDNRLVQSTSHDFDGWRLYTTYHSAETLQDQLRCLIEEKQGEHDITMYVELPDGSKSYDLSAITAPTCDKKQKPVRMDRDM